MRKNHAKFIPTSLLTPDRPGMGLLSPECWPDIVAIFFNSVMMHMDLNPVLYAEI